MLFLRPFREPMEVIYHISELRQRLRLLHTASKSLGLVPTMGALHEGHYSLASASIEENDLTLATIFVNPAQFNNSADLAKYPVSLEQDLEGFRNLGVDLVFCPSQEEMYPEKPILNIDFGHLAENMEGAFRPGHFNGVGLVVAKLFNLVRPDRAYFGQKDLQQFYIIRQLNRELNFDIDLRMMPTIREDNGLAMSSRNRRLDASGIEKASVLFHSLELASELFMNGSSIREVKDRIKLELGEKEGIELEYFEVVSSKDLKPLESIDAYQSELVLCIAAHVDGIRLIDNTFLNLRRN